MGKGVFKNVCTDSSLIKLFPLAVLLTDCLFIVFGPYFIFYLCLLFMDPSQKKTVALRANIVKDCIRWKREGERGEADSKFTTGLVTRTKKLCERDK
jgi:hypothetical protein